MAKLIPPSMRERNRYIAFEFLSDSGLGRGDVVKASWTSILRFLGEHGASKTSLWVMDWDEEKQQGLLKVSHRSVEDVRCALSLAQDFNGKKGVFHVLGVTGTVKSAREKYLSA